MKSIFRGEIFNAAFFVFFSIFLVRYAYAGNQEAYDALNTLKCGDALVTVRTFCSYGLLPDASYPFCTSQNITILYQGTNHEIKFDYRSLIKATTEQAFVDGVSCIKNEKEYVVAIESTDFGNCDQCTWFDVFRLNGTYQGSSPGIYHLGNFPSKKLDQNLARIISAGKSKIEDISIFRPKTYQDRGN